jgi:hypothetical protein
MAVCNNTGTVAIYNSSQNLFLSPMADGPIKFNTSIDNNLNIENVSKYGRQFSILKIPYAFKLLIQELQTMNIQMRLITEDNIDQLTSMGYSNNILKLRKDDNATTTGSRMEESLKINITNEIRNRRKEAQKSSVEINVEPEADNVPTEFPAEHTGDTPLVEPEAFGWSYYSYDEDRGEAYKSIILNNKGDASEVWFVSDHDGQLPNRYPAGWNVSSLLYNDKTPISPNIMIEELNATQEPNNWNISLDAIRREDKGKVLSVVSPDYPPPASPDYPPPASPDYPPPTSPDYPPPASPQYPPPASPTSVASTVYNPNSPISSVYDPNSPYVSPNGFSPPFAPSSGFSPPFAPPTGNINSMSSDYSVPPPPPPPLGDSASSDVSDVQSHNISELDNIEKMLEKTKTKRDDGIELIINTDEPEDEKEKQGNEKNDSNKSDDSGESNGEKKIIKIE